MNHILNTISPTLITVGHGVLLMLSYSAGSWFSRKLTRSGKERKSVSLVIEGTLLSLLLGFTFNNAYDKFVSRKKILNDEINAITSAHAFTTIYPDSIGQTFRAQLARYSATRRDYYYATADARELSENMSYSENILDSLNHEAAAYYRTHATEVAAANMLLQISNLSDIMSTRELLRTSRVPVSTLRLLLLLSLIVIFLMGVNNTEKKPNWLSASGFTLLITMTVFLIVDLDIAERGTITINDQQEKMIKATANLKE